MLSRFRKEIAPIELYGKLPIAKDYLRIGGGHGAAIALRDWADQSYSTLGDRADPPTLAWPGRFVLAQYSSDPLMGCAWPSSDSGGHRPFPFFAFVTRRRKALATQWQDGGAALRPLWDRLVGVFTSHRSYGDGQSYLAAMRGEEIEVGALHTPEAQRVDFDQWLEALWPDGGTDDLVRVLAQLAARRGASPVRLPLVAGLPSLPQVHAWTFALTELGVLTRGALPSMVFPVAGEDGENSQFVTYLLEPLDPSHEPWLARPSEPLGESDHAHAERRYVSTPTPPSESTPPLAESLRGPLVSARAYS